ncbi:hypothetical protein AAFF_G00192700 [Aldrovandia affinis]|uniref:Uncharacterized protein n=1 Tax=Aldrovandia affinis TaxID=143900 RepID=A0AAD7RJ20_9TELE|nr:hypothetical protein AAFF_G00192700 [Aldrovandia affinis]
MHDLTQSHRTLEDCIALRNRQVPRKPVARRQVVKENSKLELEGNSELQMMDEEGEDVEDLVGMNPIVVNGGHDQYTPWSFMDMVGLAGRLLDLTEGAGKWITALEESTGGIRLALDDMKALLMHMVGKHVTDDIFQNTGLSHLSGRHVADYVGFNGFRNQVWGELRQLYPDKLDPSKLEGEELKEVGMLAHPQREEGRREEKVMGSDREAPPLS